MMLIVLQVRKKKVWRDQVVKFYIRISKATDLTSVNKAQNRHFYPKLAMGRNRNSIRGHIILSLGDVLLLDLSAISC